MTTVANEYPRDGQTRLEYLEAPVEAPKSPPPPGLTPAAESTYDRLEQRLEKVRRGGTA